jgi:hypothetical protein
MFIGVGLKRKRLGGGQDLQEKGKFPGESRQQYGLPIRVVRLHAKSVEEVVTHGDDP